VRIDPAYVLSQDNFTPTFQDVYYEGRKRALDNFTCEHVTSGVPRRQLGGEVVLEQIKHTLDTSTGFVLDAR